MTTTTTSHDPLIISTREKLERAILTTFNSGHHHTYNISSESLINACTWIDTGIAPPLSKRIFTGRGQNSRIQLLDRWKRNIIDIPSITNASAQIFDAECQLYGRGIETVGHFTTTDLCLVSTLAGLASKAGVEISLLPATAISLLNLLVSEIQRQPVSLPPPPPSLAAAASAALPPPSHFTRSITDVTAIGGSGGRTQNIRQRLLSEPLLPTPRATVTTNGLVQQQNQTTTTTTTCSSISIVWPASQLSIGSIHKTLAIEWIQQLIFANDIEQLISGDIIVPVSALPPPILTTRQEVRKSSIPNGELNAKKVKFSDSDQVFETSPTDELDENSGGGGDGFIEEEEEFGYVGKQNSRGDEEDEDEDEGSVSPRVSRLLDIVTGKKGRRR